MQRVPRFHGLTCSHWQMGIEKLILYVPSKGEYTAEQAAFVNVVAKGAQMSGASLEVKPDSELEVKSRACLVPFVHVPSNDLVLFEEAAFLQYVFIMMIGVILSIGTSSRVWIWAGRRLRM